MEPSGPGRPGTVVACPPAADADARQVLGLFDDPDVRVLTRAVTGDAIASLSPQEAHAVANATGKRQREFATARTLAREGLERFYGICGFDLLNAEDRRPIWPDGIEGSVSHCDTRAWVALVDARHGTIGIDGEARAELRRDLWRLTLRDEEVAYLESLDAPLRGRRALALFTAKEALYKAQYPRSGLYMEYKALRVEADAAGALRCIFQQHVGPFPRGFVAHGRSLEGNELVSAVWIPAT